MVPATVLQAASSSSSFSHGTAVSWSPRFSSFNEGACTHSSISGFRRWSEHISSEQPLGRSSISSKRVVRRTSPLITSAHSSGVDNQVKEEQNCLLTKILHKCAVCLMASVTLASIHPLSSPAHAFVTDPIISDLAVLISGPPVKDPNALLRYALPVDSKPIKEVQKSLENVSDNLKLAGERAFDPVERNVRQAARALSQNKTAILASLADSKKEIGQDLLDKLTVGLQEMQKIVEDKNREAIAPKQKELLYTVGDVEEAMIEKFPFEVPEEYANKPLLKGRARVEMKVKVKDNPNLKDAVFQMVLDGYNAPVTAGNFIDLVERHFYDGMEIQRADGFVVQTGDPDGPSEGFVDPSTEKIRTIPLEIMVDGDKQPIYEAICNRSWGGTRPQQSFPSMHLGHLPWHEKSLRITQLLAKYFGC